MLDSIRHTDFNVVRRLTMLVLERKLSIRALACYKRGYRYSKTVRSLTIPLQRENKKKYYEAKDSRYMSTSR